MTTVLTMFLFGVLYGSLFGLFVWMISDSIACAITITSLFILSATLQGAIAADPQHIKIHKKVVVCSEKCATI